MSTEKIEVNGLDVIREMLLTRGEDMVTDETVPFKELPEFALIVYRLTANATNKMWMKNALTKFFMRNSLVASRNASHEILRVYVPPTIYNEVKAINDSYRNKAGKL